MKTLKNHFKPSYVFLLIILFIAASCTSDPDTIDGNKDVVEEEIGIDGVTTEALAKRGFQVFSNMTRISINTNRGKAISPYLFGVNNDWRQITNASYNTFAESLGKMNYQGVRFPGGWESEFYDWSENTTPGWRNTPDVQGASIETVKNTNPPAISIVVPTRAAMNLPQWSDNWFAAIQELKGEAVEAINSTGPNGILSVEIGNEWWLQWGGGVSRINKLKKYAHIAKRIARHVKTKFPNATFKLLVNGDYTVPEEFTTIKTIFGDDINDIDGLTLHTYAGFDSDTHDLSKLEEKISACKANLGKDYLSLSEWVSSKAYNNQKVYAEAANVLVDHINAHAKAGANEAAFWPPTNNAIPGLGLFNTKLDFEWPSAQIFGDMAQDFKGNVLDVTNGTVRAVASRKNNGDIVTYIVGGEAPQTTVVLATGRSIKEIKSVTKWEPGNLDNTAAAVQLNETDDVDTMLFRRSIVFNVNQDSPYTIYKIIFSLQ